MLVHLDEILPNARVHKYYTTADLPYCIETDLSAFKTRCPLFALFPKVASRMTFFCLWNYYLPRFLLLRIFTQLRPSELMVNWAKQHLNLDDKLRADTWTPSGRINPRHSQVLPPSQPHLASPTLAEVHPTFLLPDSASTATPTPYIGSPTRARESFIPRSYEELFGGAPPVNSSHSSPSHSDEYPVAFSDPNQFATFDPTAPLFPRVSHVPNIPSFSRDRHSSSQTIPFDLEIPNSSYDPSIQHEDIQRSLRAQGSPPGARQSPVASYYAPHEHNDNKPLPSRKLRWKALSKLLCQNPANRLDYDLMVERLSRMLRLDRLLCTAEELAVILRERYWIEGDYVVGVVSPLKFEADPESYKIQSKLLHNWDVAMARFEQHSQPGSASFRHPGLFHGSTSGQEPWMHAHLGVYLPLRRNLGLSRSEFGS